MSETGAEASAAPAIAAPSGVAMAAAPVAAAAVSTETLTYRDVLYGDTKPARGLLKLAPIGLGWKPSAASATQGLTVARQDIRGLAWARVGPASWQLRVAMAGACLRFAGLRGDARADVERFAREHYGIDQVDRVDFVTDGHNWGGVDFSDSAIVFRAGGDEDDAPETDAVFEVPFSNVANTSVSRNDVILTLHQPAEEESDSRAVSSLGDMLAEIRFFVPNSSKDAEAGDGARDLLKRLQEHTAPRAAGQGAVVAQSLASLQNVNVLTPRGRFEVLFYIDHLILHGKSSVDTKIMYKHIVRLHDLEKGNDSSHRIFVVGLSVPIKGGPRGTALTHIVLSPDEAMKDQYSLTDEARQKYPRLAEIVDVAPESKSEPQLMLAEVFTAVTGVAITGSTRRFTTSKGQHSFRCVYRNNDGHLYALDAGFVFAHKPPMYLPFSNIVSATILRGPGTDTPMTGNRVFDLLIKTRDLKDVPADCMFTGIHREEYERLLDFMSASGINVDKGEQTSRGEEQSELSRILKDKGDQEESEDDEDFVPLEEEEVPEEYDANYLSSDEDPNRAPPSSDDDDIMWSRRKKKDAEDSEKADGAPAEGKDKDKDEEKKKKKSKEKGDGEKKKKKKKKDGEAAGEDKEKSEKKHKHKHKHSKEKEKEKEKPDKAEKEKDGKTPEKEHKHKHKHRESKGEGEAEAGKKQKHKHKHSESTPEKKASRKRAAPESTEGQPSQKKVKSDE